ncbi:MAG: toxin [Gemmatimonadetes bacterium]|nr:toxin [Gemmatimonadota bacterium]
MSWEVEFTDEFGVWWDTLADGAQDAVDRIVGLLEARGPQLGHQQSLDTLRREGLL